MVVVGRSAMMRLVDGCAAKISREARSRAQEVSAIIRLMRSARVGDGPIAQSIATRVAS
jgi:hypothetical protein